MRKVRLVLCAGLVVLPLLAAAVQAQENPAVPEASAPAVGKAEAPPAPGPVVPPPLTIKQRTALTVFLAWLWLVIGILVYVLVLKILESDRVFRFRYFQPEQGRRKPLRR